MRLPGRCSLGLTVLRIVLRTWRSLILARRRGREGGRRLGVLCTVLYRSTVLTPLDASAGLGVVGATSPVEGVGVRSVSVVALTKVLVLLLPRPLGLCGLSTVSLRLSLSFLLRLVLPLDSLLLLIVRVLEELRRRLLVIDPAGVTDLHRHQLLEEHVGGQLGLGGEVDLHAHCDAPLSNVLLTVEPHHVERLGDRAYHQGELEGGRNWLKQKDCSFRFKLTKVKY